MAEVDDMKHVNKKKAIKGFTLIEIMVVVVILGILATFVLPNVFSAPDTARAVKAKQDTKALESGLKLYRLDNFNYPSQAQGLKALVSKPGGSPPAKNWKKGGYMDKIPKDPWGNDYIYKNPGTKSEIEIISYGSDGRPGGEDAAKDINSFD